MFDPGTVGGGIGGAGGGQVPVSTGTGPGGTTITSYTPITSPTYQYLGNNGQVQSSSTPVSYVGQGASATGAANPGLIVNSAGIILSGPGTGGTYDPTTNTILAPPAASGGTAPASTATASSSSFVLILVLVLVGGALALGAL